MIQEFVSDDISAPINFENMIRRKVESLMDFAPSDANAFTSLRKVKQGYEGILKIVSVQGRFVGRAVSENINDLIAALLRQINEQLKEWHGCRFAGK